jgi:sugar lactone lactonase YvrE
MEPSLTLPEQADQRSGDNRSMRNSWGPLAVVLALLAGLALPSSAAAIEDCADRPEVRVVSDGHGLLESIGVDRKGRIFFTDGDKGQLLMIAKRGGEPRVIADGIDAPGGIIFQKQSGRVLVGFGDSIEQAADGSLNPEAGLLRVDPRTGEVVTHTEGLQMANGIARGPDNAIYASIDIGSGIDRIVRGTVRINWADVFSANGMISDTQRESLFVNQTFTAAAIQRVPFDNPSAATTYYSAPLADTAAGFDGLTRDSQNRLYAAANGAGQIWRVSGPGDACSLADRVPFPSGPSDLAFGRKGKGFGPRNLYVVTFGGELLELRGVL